MERKRTLLLLAFLVVMVATTCAQTALGWTDDGRVVALADYRLGHLGDSVTLSFRIQNLVTDELLFTDAMTWRRPGPLPAGYDEAYALYSRAVAEEDRYGIEKAMVANLIVPDLDRTQLREFPLSMEEDDYRVLARRYDTVRPGESYPLVVQSRDMGRKAITDLSANEHYVWPFLPEFFVVDGYLINPDHSRIVVVVRIQDPESPGDWFLSTYGCALYTGFRRDAYQSPEFVPSDRAGGE